MNFHSNYANFQRDYFYSDCKRIKIIQNIKNFYSDFIEVYSKYKYDRRLQIM